MKNASLSRGAVRGLLLSLALSGSVALAQNTSVAPVAPLAPVTEVVPAPAATSPAPRPVDAAQTKVLQDAIKSKKWDIAGAAVKAGADVNAADKGGVTPLMRAADAGQTELVQLLLQNGANANALDKKGQNALHYAVPADPKKKKFGLGNIMGGLGMLTGTGGIGSLLGGGGLQSLMGSNLTSLLSGQAFNLSGKSGWSAIAGAALQGDTSGELGIGKLLGNANVGNLNAANWTNLLSSVKGSNPQVLSAMSNLGTGASVQNSALWGQFLNAASAGDQEKVATLMKNPALAPMLQQATAGLSAAAGDLPGNAARTIVTALVASGAKADVADEDGKTPTSLATERGVTDLFGAA